MSQNSGTSGTLKHYLVIYGKPRGRTRRNELLYKGPIPYEASVDIRKWALAQKKESK